MNRLPRSAAITAVVLNLALAACGGSPATPAAAAAPVAQAVTGITTPSSVSVVTAKNAN